MAQKRTTSHRSTASREHARHYEQDYEYRERAVHHSKKHVRVPFLERRGAVWFILIVAVIYLILFTRVMKIIIP